MVTARLPYLFDPSYRDPDGAENLRDLYLVIADALPREREAMGPGVCLWYQRSTDTLYLLGRDAAGDTGWMWKGWIEVAP